MLPSLVAGTPTGHSYHMNIVWVAAFTDQFLAGDPYPRWLDALWMGAGGADFFFYAPLPFWMTAVLRPVLCATCDADRLMALSGVAWLAISGLGFRALAGRFVATRWPAMVGAVLYMALPYHLGVDWTDRQALGEFAAAAIIPWHIAAYLDCAQNRRGAGLRLAGLTALVILSHLPSAMILAVAYPVLFLCGGGQGRWQSFIRLLTAAVSGAGLAAIYWLPAIMLLDSVRTDLLAVPQLTWSVNILHPINFGRSAFFDSIWLPFALLSLLSLLALIVAWRSGGAAARVVSALLVLVWLMVTPLSVPMWESTPMARIQFPWRFLILADIAFGLAALMLAQAIIGRDSSKRQRGAATISLGAMVIVAVVFAFPAVRGIHRTGVLPEDVIPISAGALEWLPAETARTIEIRSYRTVFEMAGALSTQPPIQLSGPGQVEIISNVPRALVFEADLPNAGTVVLRRTYWRHWRLLDIGTGRQIDLEPTTEFPLIMAQLPPGQGRYELTLPAPVAERLGALISALALVFLLCWWWLTRRRTES
ncbi:MAG TPA: 6-pyruvoyl-tetrahydropterin synthase-related protein [Thermohalobaculum sp.]|nr:6-pyruvoyl-tetrahydropterin synthase-related protein [Thermohalobaculum sp.]